MRRLATAAAIVLAFSCSQALRQSDAAAPAVRGIVDITTIVPYSKQVFYGTGAVLTPRGEVVTNNHVIRGATLIRVRDVDNNRTYTANVVGYSVAADVAVLQLRGASGLRTITPGNSEAIHVGAQVTGFGNAGGTNGAPSSARGTVTGLGWTITAYADDGGTEQLDDLIRTNAPIEPGDSGGPLVDSAGRTVGIDTAGTPYFRLGSNTVGSAYAIPFDRVRAISGRIELGRSSATVHVGPTAFLGLTFQPASAFTGLSPGLTVVTVAGGSPAAKAELRPGDLLTSIDGTKLDTPAAFETALLAEKPGSKLTLGWTDLTGGSHTAPIIAASGPPQ